MFYNEYMPSFSLVGVTLCKEKVSLIGDSNATSGIKNGSAGASSINLQPTQTAGISKKYFKVLCIVHVHHLKHNDLI